MSTILRRLYESRRVVAAASLAALVGGMLPTPAFSQDGIVARVGQTQQKTSPAPSGEKKDAASPSPAGQVPATASSQQSQTQTDPSTTQNPITQPLALSPEVTRKRVGVNENQEQLLALQDAITLALQNNLDIEASRQGVQIAQSNLFSLRGFYDITSGTEIGYQSTTRPTASIFGGGGTSGAVNNKSLYYNFTTSQQIERTGGNYLIEFDNSRTTTSATFSQLQTQYNPTLTFTFTQPLMRNLSIDQTRRQIQIAKRALDLSDSEFRQRVIEIISSVQRAYWDLVFALRNEQIARNSVELTRTQLENNQKMVEAGTLAPIELRSTEAALESRKVDVIVALQNITTAENVLKGLILKDPNDKIWSSSISPTDDPQFGQSQFNLDEATGLALKNRPELDQMRLQVQQKDIDIKFYKNQIKPQLNLIGIYTNTGLAGTPSQTLDPNGQPIGRNVLERFRGGYFQSLRNLFGQDFRTYQVGVSVSFPWRNRTAEGNLGRTLAESRQLDARQRQLVQNVQIEVRNALQAVEAAKLRFEAARANRIAAEAQLKGEEERFRAGLSTNFFVLERQTDLATAQGSEVRALTDYNKALADLQRVTGMTLVTNNVQVNSLTNGNK